MTIITTQANTESNEIKLTQFTTGGGCGCKISPEILDKIVNRQFQSEIFPSLLVGNKSNDDAAVFEIDNQNCIISTTDFFTPIVDDPATFGSISSVNAISDIYAMGGEPLLAIAILGWPINKIEPSVASKVLEGSRKICASVSIPLAGGHSIDCPEPIFGLAVTGKVKKSCLKRNNTSVVGSLLYLTKPIGVGIITTAQKKGIVNNEHLEVATNSMLTLNKIGATFGNLKYVNALTDVTGFGLLGHLIEMCEGSNLSAEIEFNKVPKFDFLYEYIQQNSTPGGTARNWKSYGHKIGGLGDLNHSILADPQTSGGLLVSVDFEHSSNFETVCLKAGFALKPFGRMIPKKEKAVYVS